MLLGQNLDRFECLNCSGQQKIDIPQQSCGRIVLRVVL